MALALREASHSAGIPLQGELAQARLARFALSLKGSVRLVLQSVAARKQAESALARSESDLRLLSAQLLSAQELERQRMARELHDGIAQAMGGLKYGLENLADAVSRGQAADVVATLRDCAAKAKAMIEEVRRIAMNLRPSTLDDLGILPTLGWFCREFRGLHPQLAVAAIVEVREEEIADALKTALYRIVQEAFNNVVTHAGARNISLSLQRVDHHIRLRIADDGKGFDEQALARLDGNAGGLGLASMRQRVESAGGRFSIGSKPGEGTTIVAVWPGMAR